VFVTEGEKAAACLVGIGAQTVGTVTGASGTPGAGPVAALRGREVVLWPDADAAGVRQMERVAAALAGVASSVRIYSAKGLPAGGDAAEWIERRRTAEMPAAAILHEFETSAREVAIRAVATAPDRYAETPPGDRAEAALAGLAAATGAAAIGDSLRQLGEALRGADPPPSSTSHGDLIEIPCRRPSPRDSPSGTESAHGASPRVPNQEARRWRTWNRESYAPQRRRLTSA
jgi:DNA primase